MNKKKLYRLRDFIFFLKGDYHPKLYIYRCMRAFITLLENQVLPKLHHGSYMIDTCINHLKKREKT
jgi:hypothetical protein